MLQSSRPVAYIRRSSRSRVDPGDISRQFQEETVKQLAGDDADHLDVRAGDWGRSAATEKTDRRLDFLAILDEVERGEVSAIYAYATDRIARSVEWAARLLNACRRAGVPIITSEGRFDPDNAMTDQLFYFQAMQNEGYSRQATKKRRDTVKRLQESGRRLGIAPYGSKEGEDVQIIIDMFEKVGSCYGAARALNNDGRRTRRGALWTSKTVADVLRRAGVIYRRRPKPGAKAKADWILYQLLTCHCGNTMTAMDRRSPRVTCWRARHDADHPKPFGIAEKYLLPALKAEAARLRIPFDQIEVEARNEQQHASISQKRERVIDMYADGVIASKGELMRRLGELDDELDRMDAARQIVSVPTAVDWSQPPAVVNSVLRAMWERIELGPDLLPTRFVWRVPEWRS